MSPTYYNGIAYYTCNLAVLHGAPQYVTVGSPNHFNFGPTHYHPPPHQAPSIPGQPHGSAPANQSGAPHQSTTTAQPSRNVSGDASQHGHPPHTMPPAYQQRILDSQLLPNVNVDDHTVALKVQATHREINDDASEVDEHHPKEAELSEWKFPTSLSDDGSEKSKDSGPISVWPKSWSNMEGLIHGAYDESQLSGILSDFATIAGLPSSSLLLRLSRTVIRDPLNESTIIFFVAEVVIRSDFTQDGTTLKENDTSEPQELIIFTGRAWATPEVAVSEAREESKKQVERLLPVLKPQIKHEKPAHIDRGSNETPEVVILDHAKPSGRVVSSDSGYYSQSSAELSLTEITYPDQDQHPPPHGVTATVVDGTTSNQISTDGAYVRSDIEEMVELDGGKGARRETLKRKCRNEPDGLQKKQKHRDIDGVTRSRLRGGGLLDQPDGPDPAPVDFFVKNLPKLLADNAAFYQIHVEIFPECNKLASSGVYSSGDSSQCCIHGYPFLPCSMERWEPEPRLPQETPPTPKDRWIVSLGAYCDGQSVDFKDPSDSSSHRIELDHPSLRPFIDALVTKRREAKELDEMDHDGSSRSRARSEDLWTEWRTFRMEEMKARYAPWM